MRNDCHHRDCSNCSSSTCEPKQLSNNNVDSKSRNNIRTRGVEEYDDSNDDGNLAATNTLIFSSSVTDSSSSAARSFGTTNPATALVCSWIFGIMIPTSVVAWFVTRHFTLSLIAGLSIPLLAIAQGALGILTYRLYFGDAPVPILPCHGVVQVVPTRKLPSPSSSTSSSSSSSIAVSIDDRENVCLNESFPLLSSAAKCTEGGSIAQEFPNDIMSSKSNKHYSNDKNEKNIHHHQQEEETIHLPPLRLLVIGDSLAIGVGQSVSCTPIFPEIVARSLSRRFNGRTVYWTCHGAPGASTGWIVRELERAGKLHQNQQQQPSQDDQLEQNEQQHETTPGNISLQSEDFCNLSDDTDDSTIDDSCSLSSVDDNNNTGLNSTSFSEQQQRRRCSSSSSSMGPTNIETPMASTAATNTNKINTCNVAKVWRERLVQHRNRFEQSEVLGPYDVVVVVTGSNDLKSAFFPFLLGGEDAEFRRQAAKRGGNYHLELRRLLLTLHNRMNMLKKNRAVLSDLLLRESTVLLKNAEIAVERIRQMSPTSPSLSSAVRSAGGERVKNDGEGSGGVFRSIFKTNKVSQHHSDETNDYNPVHGDDMNAMNNASNRTTMSSTAGSSASSSSSTSSLCEDDSQQQQDYNRDEDKEMKERTNERSEFSTDNNNHNCRQEAQDIQKDDNRGKTSHHHYNSPLVVLPGLPARSLPIFQIAPLRWLAVPIVEIMDLNKQRLGECTSISSSDVWTNHTRTSSTPTNSSKHNGTSKISSDEIVSAEMYDEEEEKHDVLFVPAPSEYELECYDNKFGRYWDIKCTEETVLSLRDISRREAIRLELELRQYYAEKEEQMKSHQQHLPYRSLFHRLFYKSSSPSSLLDSVKATKKNTSRKGSGLFSIDSIHPNDRGYDFWGRHVGHAIADRLLLQQEKQQ